MSEAEREYGLRDEFEQDFIEVFANDSEFACLKTFEIIENDQPKIFQTIVVWDTETLKDRMIVQQQGVYLGTVLCFILKSCFRFEPRPEEILWELREIGRGGCSRIIKQGWRVLDIVDAEKVYQLSLDKLTV